ncbi:hypothetical protein BTVI_140956 [Pitangus sulphuratus]|nr:hypothetical protein BTVI_140956 [Pitangus sulphuratus]
MSSWKSVTRSVPQGPALFNVFINDTDKAVESTLSKFADDTKLRGALTGAIHRDLDKLEDWVSENLTRFNKATCKGFETLEQVAQGVVDASSLGKFKVRLDRALRNLI